MADTYSIVHPKEQKPKYVDTYSLIPQGSTPQPDTLSSLTDVKPEPGSDAFSSEDLKLLISELLRGGAFGGSFALGTAAGGPLVGAGAAILEDLAFQKAQSAAGARSPSALGGLLGYDKNSPSDYLMSSAEELGSTVTGEKIVDHLGPVVSKLFKGDLTKSPVPEFEEFNRVPKIASSQTDSGALRNLEAIGAPLAFPRKMKDIGASVKAEFHNFVNNQLNSPTENLDSWSFVERYKGKLKERYKLFETLSDQRAANVIATASRPENTVKIGERLIKGPVQQPGIAEWAVGFLESFKDTFKGEGAAKTVSQVEDDLKPIVRLAQDVYANIIKHPETGELIRYPSGELRTKKVSFEAAWEQLKELSKATSQYSNKGLRSGEARYREFSQASKAYSDDIEKSISTWPSQNRRPNGLSATVKDFTDARKIVRSRHNLFERGDEITKLLTNDVAGAEQLKLTIRNPKAVGRAVAAGERKTVAAYNFYEAVQDAWNANKQTFDPPKLLANWFDPDRRRVAKKVLNKRELERMDHLVNVIAKSSQDPGKMGLIATLIRVGSASAYIGSAALAGKLSGVAMPLSIVGGYVGLNQFTKRVLLSDKGSAVLMNLIKTRPGSAGWNKYSKILGGMLGGSRIVLTNEEGRLFPATMKENGEIVMDMEEGEQ